MNRRTFLKTVPALAVLNTTSSTLAQDKTPAAAPTQELQPITLPKPQTDGGKSALAALQERRTNRSTPATLIWWMPGGSGKRSLRSLPMVSRLIHEPSAS